MGVLIGERSENGEMQEDVRPRKRRGSEDMKKMPSLRCNEECREANDEEMMNDPFVNCPLSVVRCRWKVNYRNGQRTTDN